MKIFISLLILLYSMDVATCETETKETRKTEQVDGNQEKEQKRKNSPGIQSGWRLGVGLTIANGELSSRENEGRLGVPVKKGFTTGSGEAYIGYIIPVTSMVGIGLQVGVRCGAQRPRMPLGTSWRNDSWQYQTAKRAINTLLTTMGHALHQMTVAANGGAFDPVNNMANAMFINEDFVILINIFRYIGGADVPLDGRLFGEEKSLDWYVRNNGGRPVNLADWNLSTLIGESGSGLGKSPMEILYGAREILKIIDPGLAQILKDASGIGAAVTDYAIVELIDLLAASHYLAAYLLEPMPGMPHRLPFITSEKLNYRRSFMAREIQQLEEAAEAGRPTFGVCPYASFGLRISSSEWNIVVIPLVGVVQFNGIATFPNGLPQRGFRALTTFIGVGVEKQIGNNLSAAIEVSHSPRRYIKVGNVVIWGKEIPQKVRFSETRVTLTLQYQIKSGFPNI
ncbi:MAG: hypothetical protein LBS14_01610 [Holosporaceae bacterium]|jgi:hypothetical protein|nr:hypothetical protein [Holosporaceae bacterium]